MYKLYMSACNYMCYDIWGIILDFLYDHSSKFTAKYTCKMFLEHVVRIVRKRRKVADDTHTNILAFSGLSKKYLLKMYKKNRTCNDGRRLILIITKLYPRAVSNMLITEPNYINQYTRDIIISRLVTSGYIPDSIVLLLCTMITHEYIKRVVKYIGFDRLAKLIDNEGCRRFSDTVINRAIKRLIRVINLMGRSVAIHHRILMNIRNVPVMIIYLINARHTNNSFDEEMIKVHHNRIKNYFDNAKKIKLINTDFDFNYEGIEKIHVTLMEYLIHNFGEDYMFSICMKFGYKFIKIYLDL